MSDNRDQLALAKELLRTVRHAAMATVNEDGTPHNTPHNTPYMFMRNDDFTKLYWGSHEDSVHSKNIARTGRVFIVLFNSFVKNKGGVYISAEHAHKTIGDELVEALAVHNAIRIGEGSQPLDLEFYVDSNNGQNMYTADVGEVEIYSHQRDTTGRIVKEIRTHVDPNVLRLS